MKKWLSYVPGFLFMIFLCGIIFGIQEYRFKIELINYRREISNLENQIDNLTFKLEIGWNQELQKQFDEIDKWKNYYRSERR